MWAPRPPSGSFEGDETVGSVWDALSSSAWNDDQPLVRFSFSINCF